ncbi:MAG: LegC family aminotransferase [Cyclobacteriaceae bacterium]
MIPLSAPELNGREWEYIKDCLDTGWVSSAGSYVDRFEKEMAAFTGLPCATATNSGTAALHISLLLAGVQAEDYVIVPDLTFVAPVNAVRYTGARPILIDADEETWQMDQDLLEEFLARETETREGGCYLKKDDKRIRCLMPVHVLGAMGDMHRLTELAGKHALNVIEDASEALGSRYDGRPAGSFGLLGCFSFNGNKIITSGGGGMIVTGNEDLAARARHLTTQAKTGADDYFHDEAGYNYRLVNVLAAIGVAQMEQLPAFTERKKQVAARYRQQLDHTGDISFQQHHPLSSSNEWLCTISTTEQSGLREHLAKNDIMTRPIWTPMHRLPMYKDELYISMDNHADTLHARCLSIPSSSGISEAAVEQVIRIIKAYF